MSDATPRLDPGVGLAPVELESVGPAIGTVFPDLVLPDQTGRIVDLHRHRAGRRALVVITRSADW